MLILTSGTSEDYNKNINNSYAGVLLNLRVWVKLGTASNFCITITNSTGLIVSTTQSFDNTNDGLNTLHYTQISLNVHAPSGTLIGLNVGNYPGTTTQTAGAVYTYGWQVCFENQTTNMLGSLSVDRNVNCSDVVYNGNSLSSFATSTDITFASQLYLINGHTQSISNINSTLTSQLG